MAFLITTHTLFSSSLIIFLLFLSLSLSSSQQSPTAYEVLKSYDLPAGFLPTGVANYTLNNQTGEFTVDMNNECVFKVAGYSVKYSSKLSGTISNDQLNDIKGVKVKVKIVFPFWVTIGDVERNGDKIKLSANLGSREFPARSFDQSICCGCSTIGASGENSEGH